MEGRGREVEGRRGRQGNPRGSSRGARVAIHPALPPHFRKQFTESNEEYHCASNVMLIKNSEIFDHRIESCKSLHFRLVQLWWGAHENRKVCTLSHGHGRTSHSRVVRRERETGRPFIRG